MRVFHGFDSLPTFGSGVVATVGSFDGLHNGHLELLSRCRAEAEARGAESVVLTFEPHPRVVLGRADGLRLLTSLEEKIVVLEKLGVENLVVIPFDKDFSRLSYDSFVKEYLVAKMGMVAMVVGYDHHLGRGRDGGYVSLAELSEECGFDLCRVDERRGGSDQKISSTVVRELVAKGDIKSAVELLSRPYIIIGRVDSDGRVWVREALKLMPPEGDYCGKIGDSAISVRVDGNGVMWCSSEVAQKVVIEIIS